MADVVIGPGTFPEGSRVDISERRGDFPVPGSFGKVLKSTKIGSDGATVKGLDEGRYWAVSDEKAVGVTAKDVPAPKKRVEAPTSADPQLTPSFASTGVTIVTGPRGTTVNDKLTETPVLKHDEANPHLNQASVGEKVPQRSNTALGEATPVDPGEPQPKPRQEDVRKGVDQRSDTETGEASVVSDDAGPSKQEDAKKSLKQRSATESGEQTPIGSAEPRGTASNPDSREVAAGERPTDEKPAKRASSVKPAAAKSLKQPKK